MHYLRQHASKFKVLSLQVVRTGQLRMWHYYLTYHHLQKPRCCKASRNPLLWDVSGCVTHWHKVWKLVPGLYIGNRHELISFHDTSCANMVMYNLWSMSQSIYDVRVIFILICPWINLKQTCMVNPLVFTKITFLVSTVNTAFVNTVLGNLQKWCDLVPQDYDCHFFPNIFELKL
jgi:hypothetical protein